MKILLRNPANGLYYAAPDRWTESQFEAFDFQKVDSAMDCAGTSGLHGLPVEVLMRFDDPALEIPLRIVGLGP